MTTTSAKIIMLIEDDIDILYTLKDYLQSEGYIVLTAQNGFLAMELLAKSKMPNLILLDMKMPVMDGWEFAKVYLEKYGHQAPIVVMTAAADAEQRAKEISAIGWIEKPFDLDILLKEIKKFES